MNTFNPNPKILAPAKIIFALVIVFAFQTTTFAQTKNLESNWEGYFASGKKSSYVWTIAQSEKSLAFLDVGAGTNTAFTGQIAGSTITDSNRKTGAVSADLTQIRWSDGVIWKKQIGGNSPPKAKPVRRLQMVYVIPQGQTAKPRATEVLAAIAKALQRHYFKELGVTFELENPLVSTVRIVNDINYAIGWDNHIAMIKSRYSKDYTEKENVIFTVIEGAVGAGGGSWNTIKMPGKSFFDSAYDAFINDPGKFDTKLHGFSHELGHAFGLAHTEDSTKPCFQKSRITLDTSISLIMQKKEDLGAVYNYPFLPEEKRMLLDPNYMRECLPLLKDRPHPSLFLRVKRL